MKPIAAHVIRCLLNSRRLSPSLSCAPPDSLMVGKRAMKQVTAPKAMKQAMKVKKIKSQTSMANQAQAMKAMKVKRQTSKAMKKGKAMKAMKKRKAMKSMTLAELTRRMKSMQVLVKEVCKDIKALTDSEKCVWSWISHLINKDAPVNEREAEELN